MPASTRPECTSRTALHNVTAAAVGEIRTFRSGDSHGVAFDLGDITVFPDGRRTAERIGNAVQLGERIARDARRLGHACAGRGLTTTPAPWASRACASVRSVTSPAATIHAPS